MIARYQRRPRVGRRMCDGHKLAVDADVGADGRRSTMTSSRSRSAAASRSRSAAASRSRSAACSAAASRSSCSRASKASSTLPSPHQNDEAREHATPAPATTSRND